MSGLTNDNSFDRRELFKKGFYTAAGALGGAIIIDIFDADAVSALSFKTVKTTPVRNGPSIRSTQVATLAAGTVVNVGSQCAGSRLEAGTYPNNATWNRLADGRWIHDHFLDTAANLASEPITDGLGGYIRRTAGLARTNEQILGRTARDAAAWWAETQLGVTSYNGYCLQFCKVAWWAATENTSIWRAFGDANGAWTWAQKNIPASRRGGPTSTAPRGAICHWSGTSGHAAMSAGGGYVVTTRYSSTTAISWAAVSTITGALGRNSYLGWWLPE